MRPFLPLSCVSRSPTIISSLSPLSSKSYHPNPAKTTIVTTVVKNSKVERCALLGVPNFEHLLWDNLDQAGEDKSASQLLLIVYIEEISGCQGVVQTGQLVISTLRSPTVIQLSLRS